MLSSQHSPESIKDSGLILNGGFRGTLEREKILKDFNRQGRERKDERQITLVSTWGKSRET